MGIAPAEDAAHIDLKNVTVMTGASVMGEAIRANTIHDPNAGLTRV